MVRVLHLLSQTPDFQTERTAAAIRRYAGKDFSISTRTIGRGGDFRSWHFAFFGIRSRRAPEFDVIHTFDGPALKAAVRTGKALFSPSSPLAPKSIHDLGPEMGGAPSDIICTSSAEQRVYAANRIPADCCHVVQPPVDFEKVTGSRNLKVRAALGFRPDDHVILLPGESERASGHREGLWTISILHVLYPNYRAMIWGRGSATDTLERLAHNLHQPNLLTIAERKLGRRVEFEELLSAADMALLAPSGPTPLLPLALCMSAGLPIVATQSPLFGDLLKDGHNAVFSERSTPRKLAQRIIELRDDPALLALIATRARAQAKKLFPANQVVRAYRSLYNNIATIQDVAQVLASSLIERTQ